jgi:hypothetical protein
MLTILNQAVGLKASLSFLKIGALAALNLVTGGIFGWIVVWVLSTGWSCRKLDTCDYW